MVRPHADRCQQVNFAVDAFAGGFCRGQRMPAAGVGIALDQLGNAAVEINHLKVHPRIARQNIDQFNQSGGIEIAVAHINAKPNRPPQRWPVNHTRYKAQRQVVDHLKPQIFQGVDRRRAPSPRRASDQNQLMLCQNVRLCRHETRLSVLPRALQITQDRRRKMVALDCRNKIKLLTQHHHLLPRGQSFAARVAQVYCQDKRNQCHSRRPQQAHAARLDQTMDRHWAAGQQLTVLQGDLRAIIGDQIGPKGHQL